MRYIVSFNVDDVNKIHDFGVWTWVRDESNVMESVEALTMLGFKPTVSMTD